MGAGLSSLRFCFCRQCFICLLASDPEVRPHHFYLFWSKPGPRQRAPRGWRWAWSLRGCSWYQGGQGWVVAVGGVLRSCSSGGLRAGDRGLIPAKPTSASHPGSAAVINKGVIRFKGDAYWALFVWSRFKQCKMTCKIIFRCFYSTVWLLSLPSLYKKVFSMPLNAGFFNFKNVCLALLLYRSTTCGFGDAL